MGLFSALFGGLFSPPSPSSEKDCAWTVVPDEPNLFNYDGDYDQYFTEIFTCEFPEYRIEIVKIPRPIRFTVFTFFRGTEKALIVEIMSEKSNSAKLRNECRVAGIPYLRYYYDHQGWWNLRSYVVSRTRAALTK